MFITAVCVIFLIKEVIVSTANWVLVGILITIGDVTRNIMNEFRLGSSKYLKQLPTSSFINSRVFFGNFLFSPNLYTFCKGYITYSGLKKADIIVAGSLMRNWRDLYHSYLETSVPPLRV